MRLDCLTSCIKKKKKKKKKHGLFSKVMYHISVPFSCKLQVFLHYDNIWKGLMLMSSCFSGVCAAHYLCSSNRPPTFVWYFGLKSVLFAKKLNDVLWYYSGLKILFIVTLSMFVFFSFCKYNLRHFYERKTKMLENDFLVQLLRHAVLCGSECVCARWREFKIVANHIRNMSNSL